MSDPVSSTVFRTRRLVFRNHVDRFSTTTNDKGFEILLRARPPHIRQIPSGNRWIQAKVCDEFSHCLEPQDPATTRFEMWLRYRELQPQSRGRSVIIEIRTLACRFFLCFLIPTSDCCASVICCDPVCVIAVGPSAQRLFSYVFSFASYERDTVLEPAQLRWCTAWFHGNSSCVFPNAVPLN